MRNVASWIAIGRGTTQILFLGFRNPRTEQEARQIVHNMMSKGSLPQKTGTMFLPDGMQLPSKSGNWSVFIVGFELDVDIEAAIVLILKRFKERIGCEPERRPAYSPEVTQVCIDIAERGL